MSNLNRFQFIGNLTKDIELRYTGNDKAVGNFDIAVDRVFKKDEQTVKEADYFRITIWGQMAENAAKYLGAGSKIYVEGAIKSGSYEKEGVKHFTTDFTATNIVYLSTKEPGNKSAEPS